MCTQKKNRRTCGKFPRPGCLHVDTSGHPPSGLWGVSQCQAPWRRRKKKSFRTRAKRELVNKTVREEQDWGQVEKVSPYPSQGELTWFKKEKHKHEGVLYSTYCGMPLQNIWSSCHHHPSTLVVSDLEGTRAMTRAIDESISIHNGIQPNRFYGQQKLFFFTSDLVIIWGMQLVGTRKKDPITCHKIERRRRKKVFSVSSSIFKHLGNNNSPLHWREFVWYLVGSGWRK